MDEKNKQTRSPVYGVGGFVYDVTIIGRVPFFLVYIGCCFAYGATIIGRVPFNYLIAFVILYYVIYQINHYTTLSAALAKLENKTRLLGTEVVQKQYQNI